MNHLLFKKTLAIVLLFAAVQMYGQKSFDLKAAEISFDIDGRTMTGYKTGFDFIRDEVRKGWWKYAKQFGRPLDMRTYYQIKIPAETTDGNVDIHIFSTAIYEDRHTVFSLGVAEDQYKGQVQKLLVDFKRGFYVDYYVEQISLKQLETQSFADIYANTYDETKKRELLNSLQRAEKEVQALMDQIRQIEH